MKGFLACCPVGWATYPNGNGGNVNLNKVTLRFNQFPLSLLNYLKSHPRATRSVSLNPKDIISPRFNTITSGLKCFECGNRGHSRAHCPLAIYPNIKLNSTSSRPKWTVKQQPNPTST